jgi:DNA-binding transcriptional LysR family regulator
MDSLAIDDLRLFLRLATLGSLSAAARERGVPVSQVSRALTRIEAQCGARLVHRSTQGLTLSAEGETFLAGCRQIGAAVDELQGELADRAAEPAGRVRVAASTLIAQHLLVPALPSLGAAFPKLRVELEVSDRLIDLAREGIDIAIRTAAVLPEHWVAQPVGRLARALYAAPVHVARHGLPATVEDLAGHDLITSLAAPHLNQWPFVVDGQPRRWAAEGRWRSNDTGLGVNLVLEGLGIGRLATLAALPLVAQGRLVPVLPDLVDPQPVGIYAVTAPTRQRLPKVRACIAHWAAWCESVGAGRLPPGPV